MREHRASFLTDGASCLRVRVVEYDVTVPGRDGAGDELYALATALTDWQAYPAAELAACYPGRWAATETVIGEDKSAITDAGPSRGPILRSSSPHQVTQEMWAWITATQRVRSHGCHAIQAGAAAQRAAAPGSEPKAPATPVRISFTTARREAVRAMTQTLASANVSAAVLAAAADLASRRILACLLPVRPPHDHQFPGGVVFHPLGEGVLVVFAVCKHPPDLAQRLAPPPAAHLCRRSAVVQFGRGHQPCQQQTPAVQDCLAFLTRDVVGVVPDPLCGGCGGG